MSKDNLGYKQKDGNTYFTLKEGTTFNLGQTEVELAEDAEFCHSGNVGRDGIVGMLIAGGVSGVNQESFAHTIKREIDGKKVDVEVTYGGAGEPRYKAKGAERPSEVLPGKAIDGEPSEPSGAPADNIMEGVSAGAGVEMTTKEADKLDNPLQSMKSDAQLLQEHGASDKKGSTKAKK
jgi:hypothetical protein